MARARASWPRRRSATSARTCSCLRLHPRRRARPPAFYPVFGTLLSPMLAAAAMSPSSVSIGNAPAAHPRPQIIAGERHARRYLPPKTIRYYGDRPAQARSGRERSRLFDDRHPPPALPATKSRLLGSAVNCFRSTTTRSARAATSRRSQSRACRDRPQARRTRQPARHADYLVDHCHGDHRPDCPIIDGPGRVENRWRVGAYFPDPTCRSRTPAGAAAVRPRRFSGRSVSRRCCRSGRH